MGMFRTRDFLLVFGAVVFLLVAIGTTIVSKQVGTREQSAAIEFSAVPDQSYVAELPSDKTFSRSERVAEMRRKIAEAGNIAVAAPETAEDEVVASAVETEVLADTTVVATRLQQCPNYAAYTGVWSPQGITILTSEGARVVYKTVPSVVPGTEMSKQVVLQLPLYPIQTTPTCLLNDVVGIAQDGSLIRNHEVGLYGVFGEQTLIGYALDGFSIYGTSGQSTDACGGTVVAGEYRYYLSDTRETVLNCFSATPVNL